jgi:CubicO group peptidase (beta-lactamase class C family)
MKLINLLAGALLATTPALCAHGAEAQPIAAAPEAVAADTPATTAHGHPFVVPAGWSRRTAGSAVVLEAPERGSRIALVDVDAADADAAVAAAWAAYAPDARWPLRQAGARPARNGWEQVRVYQYDAGANPPRVVAARAMHYAGRWTVVILDLAADVAERRDAQLELLSGRLAPKGYTRETFAGRRAHALDATRLAALRQFVEEARRTLGVPGVALGIVQDGQVVLAEGFGVREVGKPARVDADTMFMIASDTKPLTTLMLARLVDAGRFTWDTPVSEVLPSFRLGDAQVTRQMRIRHLVCACTGLPRQDMETYFMSEGATPATVMATLATMQPTSGFGELYQYSNAMASAAGYVGGHALFPQREPGDAYDAAMQALVFDPLGMRATTFDFARALRGNHATPHAPGLDGRAVPTSMAINRVEIAGRPNGGAWSNVRDLLRYVQMELGDGVLPSGERYIAAAPLLARREQQVARGDGQGYGMGLKIDRTSGATVLHHGGIAFGYVSDMLWLPEHGVGAVLLSNGGDSGTLLRSLFRRRLQEVLFDGRPEAAVNLPLQAGRMRAEAASRRAALTVPADAADVARLAARYRSPELGEIRVARVGAATWFDFGDWRSEMATRRAADGTLAFVTISPEVNGWLEFVAADGPRPALVLRDAQHVYEFTPAD